MKRYPWELGGALAAYAAMLVASNWVLRRHPDLSSAAQAIIALLPMLPGLLACWAVVRQLRRMDELQKKVQLEALGVAFAATALLTFSYGFLEGVGFPRLTLFVVWPLMATCWSLALVAVSWRYR